MGSLLVMDRPGLRGSPPEPAADARETALVARARDGDVEAWARLYQEHFDRVFKHVTYLTGDVHAAEDLVQETFARAFVGLAQFEARASFVGWLRGIAVNVVRKHWRARYRGDEALDQLATMSRGVVAGGASDPEGAHLRQRRAEVLLVVLASLPEPLREAFVLCDLQELPTATAAAELGVTAGNLRVRATRARAKIREQLIHLGWLVDDGEERDDDRR